MRSPRSLTVLGLAALVGCGGGGGSAPVDAGAPDAAVCAPGASVDLGGHFGALLELNVHLDALSIATTDATAEALLLLDISDGAGGISASAELCDLQIPEVPLPGLDQPVIFTTGTGLIDSLATLPITGSLSAHTSCSTLTVDPFTILIGARVDPPATGLLPQAHSDGTFAACSGTSCADAAGAGCACDQESDGLPGATMITQNVPFPQVDRAYVDLRVTLGVDATVWSSDRIVGAVVGDGLPAMQQGILSCRYRSDVAHGGELCSAADVTTLKNINPDITPTPGVPSPFRAVRVDSGMSCAELVAARATLFPR